MLWGTCIHNTKSRVYTDLVIDQTLNWGMIHWNVRNGETSHLRKTQRRRHDIKNIFIMIIKYKKVHEMCFRLIEEGGKSHSKEHTVTLNKSQSAVRLTKHFTLYTLHTLVYRFLRNTCSLEKPVQTCLLFYLHVINVASRVWGSFFFFLQRISLGEIVRNGATDTSQTSPEGQAEKSELYVWTQFLYKSMNTN